MEEARPLHVRRVIVAASHEVRAVHLADDRAGDSPRRRRLGRHVFGHNGLEGRVLDQVTNRDRIAAAPHDTTVGDSHVGGRDAPALRRASHELLSRRGRDPPQLRIHDRRRPAAERAHVERRFRRVGHDERDRGDRHLQFLGDGLRERRADVLPHFGLAGEDRDLAGWRDVQPRVDVGGERLAASPRAARLLPFEARRHEQHDEAARERLQEPAAIERKQVPRALAQLVALDLVHAHRPAFPPAPAACLIAATMRG